MEFILKVKQNHIFQLIYSKRKYLLYGSLFFLLLCIIPIKTAQASVAGWMIENTLGVIILWIADSLAYILNQLAGVVAYIMNATDVSEVPAITESWKVVRDGVNITFIAVLLVAGVFNIIHYEPDTYALKEYMPNFVIAVIGVNFSKVMCLFILDFVNVLTASIYTFIGGAGKPMSGNEGLGMYGQNIGYVVKNLLLWDNVGSTSFYDRTVSPNAGTSLSGAMNNSEQSREVFSSWDQTIKVFLVIISLVVLILVFLQLIGVFFVRLIKLWVLIAVSPLFFMGLSSSFLSSISDSWWESFWKYASIPIKVSAFISMGLLLAQKINESALSGTSMLANNEALLANGESSAVINSLVSYLILVGIVVGTLYSALDAASDDGPGSKIGEFLQKPFKAMPGFLGKSAGVLGTGAYVLGDKIDGNNKYRKFFGKGLKILSSPLRAESAVKGVKESVGGEWKRTKELEHARITNNLIKGSHLGKLFNWAKTVEDKSYHDQVHSHHEVYKNRTSPELEKILASTNDRAEQEAIIKVLSENHGVSHSTLFENKAYEKFRDSIGYKKDESKTRDENWRDYQDKVSHAFHHGHFWNTINQAATKARDGDAAQADTETKELEEMGLQSFDNIKHRIELHLENGNTWRAVALAARNIQDSNLTGEEAMEMVKEFYDSGKIGVEEFNMFGRIGQRDGKGGAAMLRRFNTPEEIATIEREFGIGKDEAGRKKFAEIMTAFSNNDAITMKDGRTVVATAEVNKMFENNLDLNTADRNNYNSLETDEQKSMIKALREGKSFRSNDGNINISTEQAEAYKNNTENKLKANKMYDLYQVFRKGANGSAWWKSNQLKEDLLQKGAFDMYEERLETAKNMIANQISGSFKQNTDGSLLKDAKIYLQPIIESGMIRAIETLENIKNGLSRDILLSDDGSLESLKAFRKQVKRWKTTYDGGSESYKKKMDGEMGNVLGSVKKAYLDKRKDNPNLPDWNTLTAHAGNSPSLKISAVFEYLYADMSNSENALPDKDKVSNFLEKSD